MMTSEKAKELLIIAGDIIELSAKYYGKYRKPPTVDSPPEAWQLHKSIIERHRQIAQQLDKEALNITWKEILSRFPTRQPQQHPKQYKQQTATQSSSVTELLKQIGILVYCCSYNRHDEEHFKDQVLRQQRMIAELLDPEVFG